MCLLHNTAPLKWPFRASNLVWSIYNIIITISGYAYIYILYSLLNCCFFDFPPHANLFIYARIYIGCGPDAYAACSNGCGDKDFSAATIHASYQGRKGADHSGRVFPASHLRCDLRQMKLWRTLSGIEEGKPFSGVYRAETRRKINLYMYKRRNEASRHIQHILFVRHKLL